jgi:hypothetical protein
MHVGAASKGFYLPLPNSARYVSLQSLLAFLCQASCLSESRKQRLGADNAKAPQFHSGHLHLLCAEETVCVINGLFGLVQGLLNIHGRHL